MKNFNLTLSVLFFLTFLSSFSQTISNCNAPSTLSTNYKKDISDLALKRIFSLKNSDTSKIEIPQEYKDTVLHGLAAIFNVTSMPERDSVFNMYCIHNSSPNNTAIEYRIHVGVDPSYSWTSAWASLTTTTGFTTLDNLLSRHGFTINSFSSSYNFASLTTTKEINILELCDSLDLLMNGITYADPDGGFGDGKRIDFDKKGDTLFYNFSIGWSDCNSGCIERYTWKFSVVYSNCSVKFLGISNPSGNSIPSYIIPSNCNLTGIYDNKKEISIQIFPNPATNLIQINFNDIEMNSKELKIIDVSGKIVMRKKLESNNNSINISKLTKGIYVILIENNNEYTFKPKRFIKL